MPLRHAARAVRAKLLFAVPDPPMAEQADMRRHVGWHDHLHAHVPIAAFQRGLGPVRCNLIQEGVLGSAESWCPRVARGALGAMTEEWSGEGVVEHDFDPVSDQQPAWSSWHPGGTHMHLLGAASARPQLKDQSNLVIAGFPRNIFRYSVIF